MIPRCHVGKGVSGAARYALGEGNDPATGKPRTEPKGEQTRVAWMSGTGFGFEIESREDADLARRVMEFDALNQTSKTKLCEKDCVHLSLGWRPGEQPTREQMEEAAHSALKALGMENARAIFVAHNDESYAHLHIVASKLNPATGKAYDLKGDRLKLSAWAEQYERDFSGGIVCTRREENNQLREAVDRRDAGAVLELLTQQRATFKPKQLEAVLSKQIKSESDRAEFTQKILTDPQAVPLADRPEGQTTRYTTRAVLEAEHQVLHAAAGLARNDLHEVNPDTTRAVLSAPEFQGMSGEQARAFRHATQESGLALIDGQAGTGKSFTIKAIRQAYEADGYHVIGLAPTNAVAQDMKADGFAKTSTALLEVFALNNGRTAWNDKTAIIVDEAAMLDTKLLARIATHADEAGAKLLLVGDDRQLSSIERGGMFGVLKDQHGAAELTTVRRQLKPDEKRASELMAEGNFDAALSIYQDKGRIHWTQNQDEAREALVDQWRKDSAAAPDKSRFVFAYTNSDVDQLNADIRNVRKERGELGEDHTFQTKHGKAAFAQGDLIQFTGTDNARGLFNGQVGTIEGIEGDKIALKLDGRGDTRLEFDAKEFQDFRHGYAGTIHKGQGKTRDQTYLYHSEHWRSAPSYVALTRHRDKAELFVARNTAADVKELARQTARVDDRRAASSYYRQDGQAQERTEYLTARELAAKEPPQPEREERKAKKQKPAKGWTDSAGMVAQQGAALRANKKNQRAAQRAAPVQQPRSLTDIPFVSSVTSGLQVRYGAQEPPREPPKPAAPSRPPEPPAPRDPAPAKPAHSGTEHKGMEHKGSQAEPKGEGGKKTEKDYLAVREIGSDAANEQGRDPPTGRDPRGRGGHSR